MSGVSVRFTFQNDPPPWVSRASFPTVPTPEWTCTGIEVRPLGRRQGHLSSEDLARVDLAALGERAAERHRELVESWGHRGSDPV